MQKKTTFHSRKSKYLSIPDYEYSNIYFEVYGAGERSSLGTKRIISIGSNKIISTSKNVLKNSVKKFQPL